MGTWPVNPVRRQGRPASGPDHGWSGRPDFGLNQPAAKLTQVRPVLTFGLSLIAALVWTLVLVRSPAVGSPSALLMGLALITSVTIATVGMVIGGGRWARWLALAGLGMTLITALLTPIDALWLVGVGITSAAAGSLFLPTVTSRIRRLPAATGPPQRAVFTPLLLVTAPFFYGAVSADTPTWPLLLVGLSAPLAAFAYSRVLPGGLWAIRLAWPALAVGLVPLLDPATAVTSVVLATAVAFLAWHPSVKIAFHPPREKGSTYPIPPELAPSEILEAADIDERGRPR